MRVSSGGGPSLMNEGGIPVEGCIGRKSIVLSYYSVLLHTHQGRMGVIVRGVMQLAWILRAFRYDQRQVAGRLW